jgi:hypothetical protein
MKGFSVANKRAGINYLSRFNFARISSRERYVFLFFFVFLFAIINPPRMFLARPGQALVTNCDSL